MGHTLLISERAMGRDTSPTSNDISKGSTHNFLVVQPERSQRWSAEKQHRHNYLGLRLPADTATSAFKSIPMVVACSGIAGRRRPWLLRLQEATLTLERSLRVSLRFRWRPLIGGIQHGNYLHAVRTLVLPELPCWATEQRLYAFSLAERLVTEATSGALHPPHGDSDVHFPDFDHVFTSPSSIFAGHPTLRACGSPHYRGVRT